jgi:RimJ/RimL family protein N-acetyltransferase
MVPVIETARLRLREAREADLEPQGTIFRMEEVVRHLGGNPHSREETWRRMLAARGAWEMFGYGYWIVERLEDGAYLGTVGFADYKRDMIPSIEGLPEMGWIFAPHAQGKGYASEAVRAALAWANEALGSRELVAIIASENAPSIRLAEKCGFSVRQEALYNGEPILIVRRPASPAAAATPAAATA